MCSSLASPATYIGMYISWLDSHPDKVEATGSSPVIPTYTSFLRCETADLKDSVFHRFHYSFSLLPVKVGGFFKNLLTLKSD